MRRKTPKRLGIEQRRQRLLDLGKSVFSLFRYDDVSTDDIAKKARVSKGLLYHYFPSKRDYYLAVIRDAAQQLSQRTEPSANGAFADALRRSIEGFVDYVIEYAGLFRALVRGGIGSDPEVEAIVEAMREQSIERVLTRGGVESFSARSRLRLYGWIGFTEFVALKWLEQRDLGREELVEVILDGLEPILHTLHAVSPSKPTLLKGTR